MPRYLGIARNDEGDALASPTVYVYAAGTTTLSTIYSDSALTTQMNNPFTGDSDGTYEFYATPGEYKIRVTKPGYSEFQEDDIVIGQYAEPYSVSGNNSGIYLGSAQVFYHTASPESVITAPPGSVCLVNASGSGSIYLKQSGTGNTGWTVI